MYKFLQPLVLLLILCGCQALSRPNVPATLEAQNLTMVGEATAIANSVRATQSASFVTSEAAETSIARYSSINRQLQATAFAIIPPTPIRQVGAAPGANVASGEGIGVTGDGASLNSTTATSDSTTQFVESLVTSQIRESDGCADGYQTEFSPATEKIYAVTRAVSISAGTTVQAEWRVGGQTVDQGSYTTPTDQSNFCIWFPLDPASIPFTPGQWSVQLSVNGLAIEPTLFFTITDNM